MPDKHKRPKLSLLCRVEVAVATSWDMQLELQVTHLMKASLKGDNSVSVKLGRHNLITDMFDRENLSELLPSIFNQKQADSAGRPARGWHWPISSS